MDVDYTEFRDLEEAIQALTERVDVMERLACQGDTLLIDLMERVEKIEGIDNHVEFLEREIKDIKDYLAGWKKPKMPPTGPVRFDPVLNDGKADPVHEAICKAPDNTFICQQCGHVHELPQFQQSPFVTGLSVLDSLKK